MGQARKGNRDMASKYERERAAFHRALVAIGWKVGDARELTRRADVSQRMAVERCNRELTEREEKRDERNDIAMRELAVRNGCVADLSGDPRGAVVKLQWSKDGQRYRPDGFGAFASCGDPNDVCVPTRDW